MTPSSHSSPVLAYVATTTRPWRRFLPGLLFLACGALPSLSACLWAPDVAVHGYTSCTRDADCAAGRACDVGLCAVPPWHDDQFVSRRLITVENPGTEPLPSGAAVPLRIGAGGLLTSRDLGVDGRFAYYDRDVLAWRLLPSFRDIYADHLFVYLPVQQSVAPGATAQLAWLESRSEAAEAPADADPGQIFSFFDDFESAGLDGERYAHYGTGTPLVVDGRLRVSDNQRLVGRIPLVPPISLELRAQINGVNCSRFFLGVTASDDFSFGLPSAGFFSNAALELSPEVAPTGASQPRPVGQTALISTAEHRYRIDVAEGRVRFWLDDEVLAEPDLRPPFAVGELFLRVEVDAGCSLDVLRVHATPLPFATPVVQAGARVDYEILR